MFLIVHLSVCCLAALSAFLFLAYDLHFWPCAFHQITGYYCLSCGATRSALALIQLDLKTSLLLNPLPLLLAGLMLALIFTDVIGILRKRHYPFRLLPHTIIAMLGALLVFFFLRNFGLIPSPETLSFSLPAHFLPA